MGKQTGWFWEDKKGRFLGILSVCFGEVILALVDLVEKEGEKPFDKEGGVN